MTPIAATVMVEAAGGKAMLNKLLPAYISAAVDVLRGVNRYDLYSGGPTLLVVRPQPLVLIMDTRTEDDVMIWEQGDYTRSTLRQVAADSRFRILLAVPELETVLMGNKRLLEEVFEQKLNPDRWELIKHFPKRFLSAQPGGYDAALHKLLDALTPAHIRQFQQHSLIAELIDFLSAAVAEAQPVAA